jgi:hypothetical protein
MVKNEEALNEIKQLMVEQTSTNIILEHEHFNGLINELNRLDEVITLIRNESEKGLAIQNERFF